MEALETSNQGDVWFTTHLKMTTFEDNNAFIKSASEIILYDLDVHSELAASLFSEDNLNNPEF